MARWLFLGAALLFAAMWYSRTPATHLPPPGVLAPQQPAQRSIAPREWPHGEFKIEALAEFALTARVLSRADYSFGIESELAPTDLAFGWGQMSDSAVLERLDIRQSGRWYHYRWGADGPPIPQDEIVRSSANMHLIPANAEVAAALKRVRAGQLVSLRGLLVAVERGDGWQWRSSLSREDSGAGACELIWVEQLTSRSQH